MTHVLIIVQNLPVPLDRRVWLEAQALAAAGYQVSVICPKGPDDPSEQTIAGIDIYKYAPAREADGFWGFAREFSYSWIRTALLSLKVWRRNRFDVIQACNPPDTYWLLARLWRHRGVRFIFDQHDLNPELFISRFGTPRGLARRFQQQALLWLERHTYASADHVISTNESYRSIAMDRGDLAGESVTVVRSGPDTRAMRPIQPEGRGRRNGEHLLVYLGVMGPQDNVDVLIDVMDELVHRRGRTGLRLAMLGFGDCLEDLKKEVEERRLGPWIEFTGRVGAPEISEYLSSADIGLSPDLKTPLNDVSTMNKTMEYMAYGLPSVSFDLVETRVSAGDSALFVKDGDLKSFADAVELLVDDSALRVDLGMKGRYRVETILDWRPQAHAYVTAFDTVMHVDRVHAMPDLAPQARPVAGREIDLEDAETFAEFMRTRGRFQRTPLGAGPGVLRETTSQPQLAPVGSVDGLSEATAETDDAADPSSSSTPAGGRLVGQMATSTQALVVSSAAMAAMVTRLGGRRRRSGDDSTSG